MVPVILHNQRLAVGPDVFEGVVGGSNYYWGLEGQLPSAKAFNDAYRAANGGAIPTDYGAYGYTGLSSLLMAMQVAGGTDTDKVIAALEGLKYDVAKGPQSYRKCDHQSVQSVLVLELQKKADMKERRRPVQGRRQRTGLPRTRCGAVPNLVSPPNESVHYPMDTELHP